jgi:hypothetical protein
VVDDLCLSILQVVRSIPLTQSNFWFLEALSSSATGFQEYLLSSEWYHFDCTSCFVASVMTLSTYFCVAPSRSGPCRFRISKPPVACHRLSLLKETLSSPFRSEPLDRVSRSSLFLRRFVPSEFNPRVSKALSLPPIWESHAPDAHGMFRALPCSELLLPPRERDVMDFFNSYMLETCNVAVAGCWYLKHCWFRGRGNH